jgi:bifunctional non-homologous end joining protein LigD
MGTAAAHPTRRRGPPDGEDWLHEVKFDGYRMHARLDRGSVRLLTRTGLDWTHKYPPIAAAVSALGARQAYLDGELSGVFPDGITSFSMIQAASDAGNAAGGNSARFLQPGDRLVGVRLLTRA